MTKSNGVAVPQRHYFKIIITYHQPFLATLPTI